MLNVSMKRIVCILFSLCIGNVLQAQYVKDTVKVKQPFSVAFLSLNGGAGIPMGKYQTDGCALTGFNTSIMAASTIDDSVVGCVAKISYGVNNVNQALFQQALNNDNPTYTSNIFYMGSYSYTTMMLGAYFAGRSCRKFGFNIRFLIGYLLMSTPKVSVSAYNNSTGQAYFNGIDEASTGSVCYSAGVGFTYLVTNHLALFLDADYLHASPIYYVTQWSEPVNGSYPGTTLEGIKSVTQPFSLCQLTIGIGFKIPGLHFYN
jgi:hypothetical protein